MINQYRPYLLLISISVGLSVMYSIYLFEFEQGAIHGGMWARALCRFFFLLTLSWALYRFLEFRAFTLNIAVKMPLLFLMLFSFFGAFTFLEGSYRQAINIVFFLPVLFINWNKPGGDELYRYIWRMITLVVVLQMIMDPLLKAYTDTRWDNNALIGGMGNPNVFGLFLLVSAAYLYFFSKSIVRMISVPLALMAVLTGSLICGLLAVIIVLMILCNSLFRSGYQGKGATVLTVLALLVSIKVFLGSNFEELFGLVHFIGKIDGLLNIFDPANQFGSFDGRAAYIREGLNLLINNPISLIVGHPDYLPIFNGDGTWISLMVTHGIPFTLLFQLSNLYLIFRGAKYPEAEFVFSVAILIIFQVFFISNRILDYWPAGFVYLLAFSYCATRRVNGITAAGLRTGFTIPSQKG